MVWIHLGDEVIAVKESSCLIGWEKRIAVCKV